MRSSTFLCLVLTKWLELALLVTLTIFLIIGCVQLVEDLDGRAVYLTVLSIIACVFAVFNIFYNNLVTNFRYSFKIKNKCLGKMCWDFVNPVIGYCFLKKVCHDHFCTVGTAIKWTFKTIYIAVVVGLIKSWKTKNNLRYIGLQGDAEDRTSIQFETLLIIYGLHHLIFIFLRPLLFTVWTFLACCCAHDDDLPQTYPFESSLISFDYIKHHTEYYNEFQHYRTREEERQF